MASLNGAPLYTLTVEEFVQLLDERINAAISSEQPQRQKSSGRLIYGLHGIENLFGVSHKTAQIYKDTFLAPAVKQNGRKIVVDADLALELFNQRRSK